MADSCIKCNKSTSGYKCDMCGAEAVAHDRNHGCGGDHCMSKCTGCGEAQVKCTC